MANNNPFAMMPTPQIQNNFDYGAIGGFPGGTVNGVTLPGMPGPYAGIKQPVYNNAYDPLTMSSSAQYNRTPLTMLEQNAMRSGPSAWAQMSNAQQNTLAAQANDLARARGNSQTADTQSRLAQQGGLTSGARERAAEAGQKDTTAAIQGNDKQNSLNQMQVGINDEQNRISQLGQLPGMELESLKPFQMDVQNNIASADKANQYNLAQQQMYNQAIAANQQANATENSGKK